METWFHSGTYMKDGTAITIAARSAFEVEECIRRGLKPLDDKKKKRTSIKPARPARPKKSEKRL